MSITGMRRFLVSCATRPAAALRVFRPATRRGFAQQLAILRLALALALLLQLIPIALADVQPSASVAPLTTESRAHELSFHPLKGWELLPLGPGIAYADATAGITLTKSAPATVYSNDPVFSYTVDIDNPSGYTITGLSTISDTTLAGQTLVGGTAVYPWWYHNVDGEPTYDIQAGDSDSRTSIEAGGAAIGLSLPIADRTILTHTVLCFNGTVDGNPESFCEIVPAAYTEVRAPAFGFTQVPTEVCAGDDIAYLLTVDNPGGAPTTQVFTMTAQLDPAVTYIAGSASDGGTFSGGTVTWAIDTILQEDSANFITRTYAVHVPLTLDSGSYVTQTYTITSPEVTPAGGGEWGTLVHSVSAQFEYSGPSCVGSTVYFTNVAGSTVPSARTWNFGDGTPPVTGNLAEVSHVYSAPGFYAATLVVTGTCGSSVQTDSYGVLVEVNAFDVTFTADAPVCLGEAVNFTDTTAYTGTITSYLWNFGDGITSTLQNPTHVYSAAGNYTVVFTATTEAGCIGSYSDQISVGAVTASFTPSTNHLCAGDAVNFSNTTIFTDTAVGYLWNFGDGGTTTLASPTYIFHNPGTYTVVLTATTTGGCVDTASAVVYVDELSASYDLGPSPACVLETVYFTDTSTISATEPISYYWSFGDGTHSGLADPTHVYTRAGTYQTSLTISSTGGCSDTAYRSVVIQGVHAYFTATPNPVCLLTDVSFSNLSVVTSTGSVTYQWDLGDGTLLTALNPTHQYAAAGDYTVVLTATTDAGCVDTYSAVVSVEQAVADFDALPNPVCLGETVYFTDTSVVTGTVVSYLWNFGDGNGASGATANHNYLLPGNYTVQLQVTTDGGCVSTHQEAVFVEQVAADFSMDPDPVCIYEDVTFTNQSAVIAASGVTYLWDFGDGTTSTITNPLHAYTAAGNYTVVMTVTTVGGGCYDTFSDVIHVEDVQAGFTMAPEPACVLETVRFTNTSVISGTSASYLWNFGDGSTSAGANPTHYYESPGNYVVSLTVSTVGSGCVDTYTDTVHIEGVDASFVIDPSPACIGETVYFTDTSTLTTVDGATYFWEFGDGGTSTLQNPTHSYATPNSYIVRLTVTTSEAGCVDTAQQTLYVEDVNAAFTPSTTLLCAGGTVNFTNNTSYTGLGITYLWNFGDGGTSAQNNPSHTFNTPGDHTVVLTATTNSGCVDTASAVIHVEHLDASFTLQRTPACVGETIAFTDTSTIVASSTVNYAWTFGDGATSTAHNPTHAYAAAGTYPVNLTISSGGGCIDFATMLVNVQDVHADFRASPNPACVLDLVGFNNRTAITGTTSVSYLWNFGDGTTSTATSPTHQYSTPGNYTVVMTATVPAGCFSTHSTVVSIEDVVADFDVDPNPACVLTSVRFTDTSTVTGTIVSYSWTFGDGGTSTQANPAHTYLTPGNYTVQFEVETASGCTDVHSTVVQVELVAANFVASANPVCVGQTINFSNATYAVAPSGVTYAWSFGDGGTSTATSPSHAYAVAGDYTVVLTATTLGGGCTSSYSTVIHVQDVTANFTMARDPACVGETVHFTNTSVVSATGATYQWNFGDGSTTTATNPAYAYSSPGTYVVTLTARTTGAGCEDVHTETIVIEEVVAGFTPSANPACLTTPIDFTNTSVVSATSVSYFWDFGDGTTSTDEDPTHTYAASGSYDVEITVTSGGAGCTDTYSEEIVIEEVIASFNSAPNLLCMAGRVYFTNTTVFTGTGVSYLWNFGDGTTSILASPNHVYANPGTYVAVLTARTPGGCVDTASTTIEVDYLELDSINVSHNPACVLEPLTFSINGTITATSLSYWWSFSDGTYSTAASPIHAFQAPGTYSVTVYVETDTGCADTLGLEVSIQDLAASFVAGPNPACAGATVGFVNTTVLTNSASATYLWAFGDGGTSTATNPTHAYAAAGTYVAWLTATTPAGCSDTFTRSIVVQDVTAGFTAAPNPVCVTQDVQFTDTSIVAAPSATYLWTFGDGSSSTAQNPLHAYALTGSYTARLTVTVPAGCVDSTAQTIQVAALPAPAFSSNSPVCALTPMAFTNLTPGPLSGVLWNFGDGGTSTQTNPTHVYATGGTYTVTLTVTNTGGCAASTQGQVVASEAPEPAFSHSMPTCAGSPVTFTNETPAGYSALLWDFGDGTTSTAVSPVHTFSTADRFSVTLTVTNTGGCDGALTQVVIAGGMPSASFTSNAPHCLGELTVFTNTTPGNNFYNWSFGDGSGSLDSSPTHMYSAAGNYTVVMTATDMGGCGQDVTSALVSIAASPAPQIAFTPTLVTVGDVVSFSDIGTGATGWLWNFGDGSPVRAGQNVTHAYGTAQLYTVVLTATNGDCDRVVQTTVNVRPVVEEQYVYLPLVEKNAGAANNPDLTVANAISIEPVSPYMWEYATVRVTIQNLGPVAAPGFDVSLFIDRTPGVNKYYEERYEDVKHVSSLGAGATQTLSWTNYFNSAGNHTLYVYVDSRGASDEWGAVWEYNENNNLSAPLVVVVRSLYSMGSPNHDGGSGWGDEQSLEPEKVAAPE